ncbi:MAG: RNA polymerase sigma factor [Chloroflexota bacterium]|nr:RNA polymerase sigma factor [Chloroflexota bacterium]
MPLNADTLISPSRPDTLAKSAVGSYARLAGDLSARLAAARPRLARLARLNGATSDEAEDIAQETLLTAWRSLDHLRQPERFDAWLDGICRNLSRRATRRATSERERRATVTPSAADGSADDASDALALAPAADADPLDELTRRELATLVESALGLLNGAAREAVELRYLAELPSDEAAARLGLTVNTLEARLSRARKQLRAALNGPLRERAIDLGIVLAPTDEAGWRETSIWCHFCGQARMLGALADAPAGGGNLALRCPRCYGNYGVTETTIYEMPELAGLTAFRPALKRVLAHGVQWNAERGRLETACFRCGRPLAARMGRFADFPRIGMSYPIAAEHYSAVYHCAACDSYGSGAAALAGRAHPAVWRFLTERQRWVIKPDQRIEYQGAPAIRFSLHDLAADERILYFCDPETLAVRAVIEP